MDYDLFRNLVERVSKKNGEPTPPDAEMMGYFKGADMDGNGMLNRDEFWALHAMASNPDGHNG